MKKLNQDQVAEMRRLYVEEKLGSREIDRRFGYVGSQGVLRNRQWKDAGYMPPEKLAPGPKATLVEIYGERKTVEAWAADARCEVTARTIRKRLAEGVTGIDLITRGLRAGRPRR